MCFVLFLQNGPVYLMSKNEPLQKNKIQPDEMNAFL